MRLTLLIVVVLASLGFTGEAYAQTSNSVVVSACASKSYAPGTVAADTQDTTGQKCVSSGGGGGGSVTITAPLGRSADAASVSTALSTEDVAILNAPVPPGSNIIGKFGIDQTTPGTTNGIYITNPSNTPVNVTVTTPPNDVKTGPTACTSTSLCTALTVSTQGAGSVGISLTGSGTGMNFTFQGSIDGTNWFTIGCLPPGLNPTPVSAGAANGQWFCPPAGYQLVRLNWSGLTGGTVTETLNASAGSAQPVLGAVANSVEVDGANGVALSITNPLFVQPVGRPTGGLSTKSFLVLGNTTSVAIDASAGTLYALRVFNNSATIAYLKVYNTAQGSTTCGSGTPILRELIPANASGAGAVINVGGGLGVAFSTAITACVTTGIADNDSSTPAATTYIWEADFK